MASVNDILFWEADVILLSCHDTVHKKTTKLPVAVPEISLTGFRLDFFTLADMNEFLSTYSCLLIIKQSVIMNQ